MGQRRHRWQNSTLQFAFRLEAAEKTVVASVMVGMSGGVDSAISALVLLEAGRHVAGLFMKNWDEDDGTAYCSAEADYADAAEVCERLGIRLHTANFAAEYWQDVFEAFLADYRAGRTPNPDVLCNRHIKFKLFADYAKLLGFNTIATGHYARRPPPDEPFRLLKGVDANKDQSYFLQAVPRQRLTPCLFPIGHLRKPQVRERARQAGLKVHDKKDSTGICFHRRAQVRELPRTLRAAGARADNRPAGRTARSTRRPRLLHLGTAPGDRRRRAGEVAPKSLGTWPPRTPAPTRWW